MTDLARAALFIRLTDLEDRYANAEGDSNALQIGLKHMKQARILIENYNYMNRTLEVELNWLEHHICSHERWGHA